MCGHYSFKTLDDEMDDWIDNKVENGDFNNRSHLIRVALKRMKEDDEGDILV